MKDEASHEWQVLSAIPVWVGRCDIFRLGVLPMSKACVGLSGEIINASTTFMLNKISHLAAALF